MANCGACVVKKMEENRGVTSGTGLPDPAVSDPAAPQWDLGFTGKYTHGLDAKGRLIIPVAFRDALGTRFAVCPSPDFRKIAVYPLRAWVERRDEYLSLCRKDAEIRRILDMFTKYSYVDSEMDSQGRLLLPVSLRVKLLGDAKDVDINGSYDHIVVQDARKSEAEDARFEEEIPDVYAVMARVQKQQ